MKQDMYIVAFPLEHASLCVNCENIGNIARACPVCQSEQLIPLARILNKEPEPEMQQPHRDSGLPSLEQISEWKKLRD